MANAALAAGVILARLLLVLVGLAFVFPALMASDAGTRLAVASAYVLLASSLCFVLAGLFGRWSLLLVGLFAMVVTFLPIRPEGLHTMLLSTVVPVVLVLALLYAFGCLRGLDFIRRWRSITEDPYAQDASDRQLLEVTRASDDGNSV